ncbi:MAG: hypothetical protein WD690_19735 [Vicinamibacterales bacterium]
MDDPRWGDPRDRDDDPRDIEIHWIELGRAADPREDDPRARDENVRERDRDARERDHDPRDVFLRDLDLPRGLEREIVIDGDHRYELNGDDTRSLATVGAFRVVSERDLGDPRDEASNPQDSNLHHLRGEGLMRFVAVDGRERAVTLTERGHHLLEAHRSDREGREQAFYAGVNRPRELAHDAQLYRAYLREEGRLREQGADIRGVTLEHELKREYQEWLQERNRGRPDSDGRPDRDPREIEDWARDHELPYFDDAVHFPDFRVEYELHGRDQHEDVEVVTEHYRGAHAVSVARAGFRCYGRGGGTGRSGGRGFDPHVAEDFV